MASLTDIIGSDINFTYEDGLRLNEYFINSDLANVNGQIDSILERYT